MHPGMVQELFDVLPKVSVASHENTGFEDGSVAGDSFEADGDHEGGQGGAEQDEEKEEQKKPPPKLSELFETKTKDLKQMTVKLKTNGLSNRLNQALKASASQADLLGPRYASGWTYVYELVWLTLLRHVCASAFARRYASLLSVSG